VVGKILGAVQYLHAHGIAHRDLKPENLLLASRNGDLNVKISDFGLSKLFNENEVLKTACGTPGYVAPEVLRRQGYSAEVDMWSMGVITYIMLCGYPPFYDAKNPELFKKIMSGRYNFDHPWWDSISDEGIFPPTVAKDFVKRLLVVDIRKRYTAAQALQHPFLTRNTPQPPKPIEILAKVDSDSEIEDLDVILILI
jgi:calcium/calmodulin-dependent protein kinase I